MLMYIKVIILTYMIEAIKYKTPRQDGRFLNFWQGGLCQNNMILNNYGRFLNFWQGALCHYNMVGLKLLTRYLVSLQYGRS